MFIQRDKDGRICGWTGSFHKETWDQAVAEEQQRDAEPAEEKDKGAAAKSAASAPRSSTRKTTAKSESEEG